MGHAERRAMGVLDIPRPSSAYSTPTVQEAVLKLVGVRSARINNVYRKITVEFDPTLTSLDRIREIIRKAAEPDRRFS